MSAQKNKETVLRSYGYLLTQEDSTMGLYNAFLAGNYDAYGSGDNREEAISKLYECVRYVMAIECAVQT